MPETLPALTICQPYPALILLPDSHPEKKRVENRRWRLDYRGPLVIHAGKSTAWLNEYDGYNPGGLQFGALVGVVDVVHCIRSCDIVAGFVPDGYEWLCNHKHVSGTWEWH